MLDPEESGEGRKKRMAGNGTELPQNGHSGSATPQPVQPVSSYLRQRIEDRPRPLAVLVGVLIALGWVAAVALFATGTLGYPALDLNDPALLGLVAVVALVPAFALVALGYTLWRAESLHRVTEALAETALRLAEPEVMGQQQVLSVAGAVRREVGGLQGAINKTYEQINEMHGAVTRQLEQIEGATRNAKSHAENIQGNLDKHHKALVDTAEAIDLYSNHISKGLDDQLGALRAATGDLDNTLTSAGEALGKHTSALEETSGRTRHATEASAAEIAAAVAGLSALAEGVLARGKELSASFSEHKDAINEAANELDRQRAWLDVAVKSQDQQLVKAGETLSDRVSYMQKTVSTLAGQIEGALDIASERAGSLGLRFGEHVTEIVNSAEKAAATVGEKSEEAASSVQNVTGEFYSIANRIEASAAEASSRMRVAIAEEQQALTQTLDQASGKMEGAGSKLTGILMSLGATIGETTRALDTAFGDFDKRLERMPQKGGEAADELRKVLDQHADALHAAIDDATKKLRKAGLMDESGTRVAQDFVPVNRLPDMRDDGTYGLDDIITASVNGSNAPRRSKQILEALSARSINLETALQGSAAPELWRQYRAGERKAFSRKLQSLAGKDLMRKVEKTYEEDPAFRTEVDGFVGEFEELLHSAERVDKHRLIADTYLTSDLGRIYLVLAEASGRLSR